MTITLNTDYDVTLNTALLGYVGETNARPVSVEGLTVDGADRYVLTIDYGDGTAYEVDIAGGQWTPTADVLRSAQTVSCQICAKKLSGDEYILVKKSRIFRLRIGAAIGDTAIPSPDVAVGALDRIDAIGRQAHADMQTAVTAAETATTAAENAKKSATNAGVSADTAAQASTAAQQTTADKNITAGYAKTAKTCADSTTADRQAVQTLAEQVTADKATVADNAAKVAEDRTAAEAAAQTAQAVADSLPDDYVTAVGKIAENTAEIANVKLTDKELKRRVDALFDMGQGITHRFETDSETAYQKTIPTGAKLMSVKSVGGHSEVIDGEIVSAGTESIVEQGKNLFDYTDKTYYGANVSKVENGVIYTKGLTTTVLNIPTIVGNKYTLSFKIKSSGTNQSGLRWSLQKGKNTSYAHDSSLIKSEVGYAANTEYQAVATFVATTDFVSLCTIIPMVYDVQQENGDTATNYSPFYQIERPIPEAIRNLPGYCIEGNTVDYEAKTYTQNNTIDGTEIKALDTPIVTDISTMLPDDFLRNIEVEAGGSITFKNCNGDDYRIPVPSEEEYVVKLSEVGGTT